MALVDQWTSWIGEELYPIMSTLAYMTFGQVEVTESQHILINGILKDKIKVVDKALKGKDWLCGGKGPTIADIQLCLAQIDF